MWESCALSIDTHTYMYRVLALFELDFTFDVLSLMYSFSRTLGGTRTIFALKRVDCLNEME